MQILDKIETERLILRMWQESDVEIFAAINQDEKVIEFLRGPLSLSDSQNFIANANSHFKKHGFGLWAATLKETKELIGFVGLNVPDLKVILRLVLKLAGGFLLNIGKKAMRLKPLKQCF